MGTTHEVSDSEATAQAARKVADRAETGNSMSSEERATGGADLPYLVAARRPRQALPASFADQPGVAEMARQPPLADQHHVEAQGQPAMLRVRREELLEGARDAAALARGDGLAGGGEAVARLDLDRGDDAAAPGDDVDLADRHAIAARQDAVAAQAQMPDAEGFRGAA